MQYTIEKPYKMVTKNAEKNLKFSTFEKFLGSIFDIPTLGTKNLFQKLSFGNGIFCKVW